MKTNKNKVVNYKKYKKKKIRRELKKDKFIPENKRYYIFAIVLALMIAVLSYVYITYIDANTVKYVTAKKGNMMISSPLQGLLLREEKIYYSEISGGVQRIKNEGEKTALNRTLLNIIEEDNSQKDEFMRNLPLQSAVISRNSGTVSYLLDGLEKDLEDGYEKIEFKRFQDIVDKTLNTYITGSTNVDKGEAVCKIISSPKWRVVTYLPLEDEHAYEEGKEYYLTFTLPEKTSISFELISKIVEDDMVKVVFETQEQQQKFLNYRSLSFYIGEMEKKGIKLPKTTIVERNLLNVPVSAVGRDQDRNVVTVIRDGNELVVPIEIVTSSLEGKSNLYFVLLDISTDNALKYGDKIITQEGQYTVNEILTESGVYVINGRVAQFKPITIIAEDAEAIIIEEWIEDGVKEKDWVILDTKSISNNQLFTKEKIKEQI